jgi:hypothetical protein
MEAIHSSETPLSFFQITWCYIPEDSTLRYNTDQCKCLNFNFQLRVNILTLFINYIYFSFINQCNERCFNPLQHEFHWKKKITVFWDVTRCCLYIIYQITRHHNPEGSNLNTHRRDNLSLRTLLPTKHCVSVTKTDWTVWKRGRIPPSYPSES